jgi:hypothetical protein
VGRLLRQAAGVTRQRRGDREGEGLIREQSLSSAWPLAPEIIDYIVRCCGLVEAISEKRRKEMKATVARLQQRSEEVSEEEYQHRLAVQRKCDCNRPGAGRGVLDAPEAASRWNGQGARSALSTEPRGLLEGVRAYPIEDTEFWRTAAISADGAGGHRRSVAEP